MKKILSIIMAVLIVATIGFIGYKHIKSQQETVAQQTAEREKILNDRIAEITGKMNALEDEKATLLDKIDALLVEDYVFDAGAIIEEIDEIGELATVEYKYTNAGTLDSTKGITIFKQNLKVPLTDKTAVITMDGVIKVGLDVKQIQISSDEASKTIIIKLPEPKLVSNELDETSLKVYDEKSGLFNKITLEDSSSIRQVIKKTAEENAVANGVYDQATDNAKKMLTCIIEAIPGAKENYTIEFKK